MKKIFITIDGKQFDDEKKAIAHENKLIENSKQRIELLKKDQALMNMKQHDVIVVSRDHNEEGNSRGDDYLVGELDEIIRHIAVNQKYWFYNNYSLRVLNTIKCYPEE